VSLYGRNQRICRGMAWLGAMRCASASIANIQFSCSMTACSMTALTQHSGIHWQHCGCITCCRSRSWPPQPGQHLYGEYGVSKVISKVRKWQLQVEQTSTAETFNGVEVPLFWVALMHRYVSSPWQILITASRHHNRSIRPQLYGWVLLVSLVIGSK
jgi:hypothetical protein